MYSSDFVIAAVAAGTMSFETFARLEVFFIAFAAASLLLALWILPLMEMAVTPFRYGKIVSVARHKKGTDLFNNALRML